MFSDIKKKIDQGLGHFMENINARYSLSSLSPLLYQHIRNFVLRDGKRARPILFLTGYLGFAKKPAPGIYTSALAIELIHDFMLVHDDIIDKAEQRRGEPSMHKAFNQILTSHRKIKFNGQDLALIIGDIMYAMSIEAFLEVKEEPRRKEKALRELIKAATFTGCGQFIELLHGLKRIDQTEKKDIYQIYDLKTARYTFASPLTTGATLAGAHRHEVHLLFLYGLNLGRAFQIKDDILGLFGDEERMGKSTLTDLQESKKTVLIWYAYHHADQRGKSFIQKILSKKKIASSDLMNIQKIVENSGGLEFAKNEITVLQKAAQQFLSRSRIHPKYKNFLTSYSIQILK